MIISELNKILTREVFTVTPEITVFSVISLMVENKVSSIVISVKNMPVGIFTERDVVSLAHRSREFTKLMIKEVMVKPVLTVSADSDIFEIYTMFRENRIRHTVVIDSNGEIAGMVSATDIVNNFELEFYLELKSVMQIMQKDILTIDKRLMVMDAVYKMRSNLISCVVIEEESTPIGVLTERDIIRLLREGNDLSNIKIEQVMSKPVYTTHVSTSVYEASKIMKDKRIRRLVIVDNNNATSGIVTQSDVIKGLEKRYAEFLVSMVKEKERKIEESQKELQDKTIFFDNLMCMTTDVVIIGTDISFGIKYYNAHAESLFKVKPQDVSGKTLIDLFKQNHLDESHLQKAKISVLNKEDYDYCFKQIENGEERYITAKLYGVWNKSGELLGIAFMAQDTTELLMTNEQMMKLSKAVEDSLDSVCIANMDGVIEYVNPSFVKLTGYTQEEAIGKTPKMLHSGMHGKLFYDKLWKTLVSGQTYRGVFINRKKNRELFYEEKSITPISISIGGSRHTHFVSTGKDITAQRKMEEEIQKTERVESIGILAGGIAHDFNNILTTILGNTNLAMLLLNPEDKIYQSLSNVEKATMRAKDLTQQLLTFSKGGLPVKKTASICELLKGTVEFALKGRNVVSEFIVAKDLYPVEIDIGQIHQVINNLVINAMQAMPEGGGLNIICENLDEDSIKDIETLERRKYIKISFKDQGSGIKKEDLPKIFNPYFTTKYSGSGLGLASSFSIIKNHGGLITVDSEFGKGTTFCIYLPASGGKVVIDDQKEDAPLKGKGRILLMDDEKTIRDLTSNILEFMGYDVEIVKDGNEAIELYKDFMNKDIAIDLVIMDLTIPGGMGGKETVAKLLEINPEVKVVISSGYCEDSAMINYKEYGFSGVIKKPFKIQHLTKVLNEVLNV